MQVNTKQLAKLLVDSCDGKSIEECKEVTAAFVEILAKKQLLNSWRQIEHEIHNAWKERYGASNVEVITAYEITSELKQKIESATPGAQRRYKVNEEMIGGARVRIDDTLIDGTVATQLKKLKTALA